MYKGIFENSPHFTRFLVILFSILVCFSFFMVLGYVLAIPIFKLNLKDLTNTLELTSVQNVPLLKFLQAFYSIGLFVFPPFIVAFFFSQNIGKYLKINNLPIIPSVVLVIITVLVSLPLIDFIVSLNLKIRFPANMAGIEKELKAFEQEADNLSTSFLQANSAGEFIANMIVMALIPAIGEEFLFRGIFQRLIKEWTGKDHLAIWITAFMFSAMHMQFYGLIPRMLLGAYFGYLLLWSGNLWLPVIAHFVNNTIAVLIFYLNHGSGYLSNQKPETTNIGYNLAISTILVALLIYLFYRTEKERQKKLPIH
ncbi:MAG: CPBP family intramembrane glutamic endopeptidase [Bacteroidales bacterium]